MFYSSRALFLSIAHAEGNAGGTRPVSPIRLRQNLDLAQAQSVLRCLWYCPGIRRAGVYQTPFFFRAQCACFNAEHPFIAHLRAAQLPVCEVLVDASGACAIDCGHWVYEVHRAMPGIDLYRDAFFWTPF